MKTNNLGATIILTMINKGRIFWTVDSKNKIQIEHLFKIEINHPWNGAAPNLKNRAALFRIIKLLPINKQKITPNKKIIEAHLWMTKYFIVFSNATPDSDDITGKKANMFISKHNHIIKEELELIIIITAIINIK